MRHRFQTHKDVEATKRRHFYSRHSYVSTRVHPGVGTQCEYLAEGDASERRLRVFERDGFKCVDCGSSMDLELSHGGHTKVSRCWCFANLWTRCRPCHIVFDGNRTTRFSEVISRSPEEAEVSKDLEAAKP
jgi:5-methylcytosine-specific restriction endonuclease McrA